MRQFLQPLHIGRFLAAVLGFPLAVGGKADALVPPDLINRAASIGLFENGYDVGLGKLRLPHGNLLARVIILPDVLRLTASIDGELTSALRRTSTASSIHSSRKVPPKLPVYSRFRLPSFSREMSDGELAPDLAVVSVSRGAVY